MQTNKRKLKAIFRTMKEDGLDVSKPLKWGFFFFDNNKEKLIELKEFLLKNNYFFEDLNLFEDNKWGLQIGIIDILNIDKLHNMNIYFNKLAREWKIELYDGWDVSI